MGVNIWEGSKANRVAESLVEIATNGIGTTNYNELSNKPQIGGTALTGNKSLHDLGIAAESDIPDVTGKTDKVQNATSGDFAALDSNGNLTDSGKKASDFATPADVNAKYTKPGSGIPSTDLASGVQTSLGKADSAYQKPGTGIPSSDMASAVQTSLGKADTAYQKPVGGIPASDLASGVLTSIIDDTAGHGATTKVWSAGKTYDTTSSLRKAIKKKPDIGTPEETDADLFICDENGYVVAEIEKGGFRTKEINAYKYITFKSEEKQYTGAQFTLSIAHHFKKGDRLVLHVKRNVSVVSYGAIVSYFADNTPILTTKRADISYIEYQCVDDCDEISVVYQGSDAQISTGTMVQLEVSLLGDIPITPTVVTVKKDGTGDYTTLRGALDFIGTKANDVLNPYRIDIYPGTYNVMDDYTSEEIAAADYNDSASGFVGPLLLNGVSIKGIGEPNEVILYGYLDTGTWTSSVRHEISVLNTQGTCGVENLTVIGKNLRYCLHDDYRTQVGKIIKRTIKNVVFRGYSMAQDPSDTYGCGVHAAGCIFDFEDVDFGENIGIHIGGTPPYESGIHFKNCKGHKFNIGDNESSDPAAWVVNCRFDNCDFAQLKHTMNYPLTPPHIMFVGDGGSSPLYNCDSRMIYNTGDVQTDPKGKSKFSGGVGTVVKLGLDGKWYLATSASEANGIVVATDTDNNYIQVRGYVKTDRTAISSPNVGDFVGISSNVAAIVQSESDAFGKIAFVDNDNNGYIKLNWRV